MMDDFKKELIVDAIKRRIESFQVMVESDEKDIKWSEENELPELASWFDGRAKGLASGQRALETILALIGEDYS